MLNVIGHNDPQEEKENNQADSNDNTSLDIIYNGIFFKFLKIVAIFLKLIYFDLFLR